jgi:hypothetical protein
MKFNIFVSSVCDRYYRNSPFLAYLVVRYNFIYMIMHLKSSVSFAEKGRMSHLKHLASAWNFLHSNLSISYIQYLPTVLIENLFISSSLRGLTICSHHYMKHKHSLLLYRGVKSRDLEGRGFTLIYKYSIPNRGQIFWKIVCK